MVGMLQRRNREGYLFLAPSLVIIFGITLFPVAFTLVASLTNASLTQPVQSFVGVDNYVSFLHSAQFWKAIQRTLYFTLVSVAVELALGLVLASAIHARGPGWKLLQTSLIIPWAVPTIVNGAMWKWIYNADYGALNGLLLQFGLIDKYKAWLTMPDTVMNLIIVADAWHSVPFVALMLQAALTTIPTELEEAAEVEGAGALRRFLTIRLPLLKPAILVLLIIRTVEAFRVFDIIYTITQGGPAFSTVTISYLTYLESFSYGKLGSGSALSFLVSIFTFAMALVYIRMFYRRDDE